MAGSNSAVRLVDGAMDFSYGADSSRVTTVASNTTPQGLPRNALAWMDNCTVRGGGIQQRNGWLQLFKVLAAGSGLYQGGFLYIPLTGLPYLMLSVAGQIYQCLLDGTNTVTNLSAKFGLVNPATPAQVWMCQGEEFLVIQAGDFFTAATPTLPLFWDGVTLRRSNGLIASETPSGTRTVTTTVGWVIPAVGGMVTVQLNQPYGGVLGDVIQWGAYGTFNVNAINGSTITLVTVSTTFAGATVPPDTYTVNVTPGPATATYAVTTTNNVNPEVSPQSFNVILSAPYGGNPGDTIQWVGVGTFTVLGLSNTNHTVSLLTQTTLVFPNAVNAGSYVWVATPPSSPSGNVATPVTTTNNVAPGVPPNTVAVNLSAPYTATAGDTLYWVGVGAFTVLGLSNGNQTISLQTQTSFFFPNTAAAGNYTFVDSPASQTPPPPSTQVSELPAATCMVYYDGIMWYAQGTQYIGGDIVLSSSGTLAYGFRDAILKVTQNQLAVGGQGFSVPTQAGNITALFFAANLNTSTGQGPLYIGTRTAVYQLNVPNSLTDWTNANNANQPVQTVAQFKYGPVGDRTVTLVNGDVFYQTLEPAIRSFQVSQRYFGQWANVPISNNENRVLRFNDRALMPTASGINFDNRALQAILPVPTPVGVAFQGIAPLDFDLISTLQEQRPPAWEGMWEGLNHLQLFEGDFGGLQRAFSVVWSDPNAGGDGGIWVWEITSDTNPSQRDKVDSRVTWYFETPAFTFSDEFALKDLDWLQLWIDRVSGEVDLKVEYRPDADNCWHLWSQTSFCAARTSCENAAYPICYPIQEYCSGQKWPISLPKPQPNECVNTSGRPANLGYQFQLRVTIKGFCRVRGELLIAIPRNIETFSNISC